MSSPKEFQLTERQRKANQMLADPLLVYAMLFGGSRSGKTFLIVRAIIIRALKAAGSRHCMLRFRFNAIKASIIFDTFPKVMKLCFPHVRFKLNKSEWFVEFENGSQIWFGGLDDKERTEKILGQEFATIYLNECSQIPWSSVGIAITRLAQSCVQKVGDSEAPLPLRMYFDCNPPKKSHWTYLVFKKGVDPDTKEPIRALHQYACYQMNPADNLENLPAGYLATLDGLPAHLRKRFRDGEFKDANPDALFNEDDIERWRTEPSDLPDMVRIVTAVDPSGSDDEDNAANDDIGIVTVGLGVDGIAYALEDSTMKGGPSTWGRMAVSAYDRHDSDIMVGEQNFGGAMVKFVIKAVGKHVKYKVVNASRGKVARAEPFSPLVNDGRVRFVGSMQKLEDEVCAFSTFGYTGSRSPNRADAFFWALAELFPGIVASRKKVINEFREPQPSNNPAARRK